MLSISSFSFCKLFIAVFPDLMASETPMIYKYIFLSMLFYCRVILGLKSITCAQFCMQNSSLLTTTMKLDRLVTNKRNTYMHIHIISIILNVSPYYNITYRNLIFKYLPGLPTFILIVHPEPSLLTSPVRFPVSGWNDSTTLPGTRYSLRRTA
jgi:hypothetical protein